MIVFLFTGAASVTTPLYQACKKADFQPKAMCAEAEFLHSLRPDRNDSPSILIEPASQADSQ